MDFSLWCDNRENRDVTEDVVLDWMLNDRECDWMNIFTTPSIMAGDENCFAFDPNNSVSWHYMIDDMDRISREFPTVEFIVTCINGTEAIAYKYYNGRRCVRRQVLVWGEWECISDGNV